MKLLPVIASSICLFSVYKMMDELYCIVWSCVIFCHTQDIRAILDTIHTEMKAIVICKCCLLYTCYIIV